MTTVPAKAGASATTAKPSIVVQIPAWQTPAPSGAPALPRHLVPSGWLGPLKHRPYRQTVGSRHGPPSAFCEVGSEVLVEALTRFGSLLRLLSDRCALESTGAT